MRLFILLSLVFVTINASADDFSKAKPKNAPLIHQYVGTYNYDGLLKEPFVEKQLRTLLGKDYRHFIENMSAIRTPIDFYGRSLSAWGARNDLPVQETAVLCVDTYHLKVHAGIFSDSAMTIYTSEKSFGNLPTCLTSWVYDSIESGVDRSVPPQQGGGEFTFTHKVVGHAK